MAQLLQTIGGLAGIAALVVSLVAVLRLGPERRKIKAEATGIVGGVERDLRTEVVSQIYDRLRAVEGQRDDLQRQLAERDRERESLRQRVDRLERMLPAAIIADLLASENRSGICAIDETARAAPMGQREALFRVVEEVHPGSLAETQDVEAGAWDGPVVEFGNRFIAADGSEVHLIWWATRYDGEGWSFARVRIGSFLKSMYLSGL